MRSDRYQEANTNTKKKKRRMLRLLFLLIIILLLAIAAAVAYSYKSAEDSLALSFTEEAPELEVGDIKTSEEYIKSSEGDVAASEDYLDTDTIGEKTLTYSVSKSLYGGLLSPSREYALNYTVKDETPPLMLWVGNGAVLERGTEFDINNVIGFGDNSDPKPEIKIDGEVDMDKNGTYPLHVTVTDAAGNSSDAKLSVEVADSVPAYTDDSPRTDFADFAAGYAGEGRSFGIDVSAWQDDVDFEKVKDAGCEFVIIRIGYSEDGVINIDDKFEQNLKRAREAGIKIGLYLYSYDNSVDKARSSAKQIIEELDGEKLDLPVAFDWEDFGRFQTYEMSFITLDRMYDAFEKELSGAGYDCMLYGSKNFLEAVWEKTDSRPVWLAHYTDKTDYKGPHILWQASSTGRIAGISGDVDLDIMYSD